MIPILPNEKGRHQFLDDIVTNEDIIQMPEANCRFWNDIKKETKQLCHISCITRYHETIFEII